MKQKLSSLYDNATTFDADVVEEMDELYNMVEPFIDDNDFSSLTTFVNTCIYGYYYDDLIAYDDSDVFIKRLTYDIAVKLPYWNVKYKNIQQLFKELDLMQSSKMTSSSKDKTLSSGGTMQKTATTPTGISTSSNNQMDIQLNDIDPTSQTDVEVVSSVATADFVDRYTNYQGKTQSGAVAKGERSSTISRQGDIETYLRVLEKLPSSFANEITKAVSKHFIQDYDGEIIYE